jgi:peptide/nickel transport system substrate-binding protein/oligopeptide transport system substrate-binding protein
MEPRRRIPVGAGPWKVASWQEGERLMMERFEDYWEGPTKAKFLQYRAIQDLSTWRAEFDAGNVDFYAVSESDYRTWRDDPRRREIMRKVPELNVYYLSIATNRPPFDDIRVRQAIAHAINVEEIFEFVHLGRGDLSHGPVPLDIEGYQEGIARVEFNPDRARELLAEAGRENLEIRFFHPTDDIVGRIAMTVRQNLEQSGFRVQLRTLDRAAYRQAIRENEPDLAFSNWWADYPDIENFIYPLFHSDERGSSNAFFYSNPEVDAMLEEARFTANVDRRLELFREIERRVIADHPAVWLWHRSSYVAVNPRIQGYNPHPMLNGVDFHNVSIAPAN